MCSCSGRCCCNHYGFFSFVWDCFMFCITAGFWTIWIFVREMRKRRRYC